LAVYMLIIMKMYDIRIVTKRSGFDHSDTSVEKS